MVSLAMSLYSVINVMSNVAYAGMRAQGSDNTLGRTAAFIGGFPGTLVSFFAVDEGSERAYGIHLPAKNRPKIDNPY
jgi:hypothetical protein